MLSVQRRGRLGGMGGRNWPPMRTNATYPKEIPRASSPEQQGPLYGMHVELSAQCAENTLRTFLSTAWCLKDVQATCRSIRNGIAVIVVVVNARLDKKD